MKTGWRDAVVHNPSTRLKRIAITLCSTRSVLLTSAPTADERCIYGDAGGVDWGGASGMLGGYWRQQWGRWRFFLRENWLLYGLLRRLLWRRCRAPAATSVDSCERVLRWEAVMEGAIILRLLTAD